jgi:hypothetical protein
MTVLALDTDQAKTMGIVVIAAIVIIGFVIGAIISAIVGRLIVLVVVVALGIFVYTQRAEIQDAAKKCDASFFGIHLTPSDPDLKAKCQDVTN